MVKNSAGTINNFDLCIVSPPLFFYQQPIYQKNTTLFRTDKVNDIWGTRYIHTPVFDYCQYPRLESENQCKGGNPECALRQHRVLS